MAYPRSLHEWEANRSYLVGEVVRASVSQSNTLAFKCKEAGTSGDSEPIFPRQITKTVEDGDIVWEAFEPLAEELLKLAPTAVIDLFEVELTQKVNGVADILRYHAGKNGITEDIKFGGIVYPAVPVEVDGFEFSAKGTLPRPTLRVANVNNAITSLMASYSVLGATVRRIRTFAKFIDKLNFDILEELLTEDFDSLITQSGDNLVYATFNDTADPDAKMIETWYIDRVASETQQLVEFELSPKLDLTNLALPRRTIEEFCPWVYKGVECGYKGDAAFTVTDQPGTAATDVCGKRLSSCRARFPGVDNLPFGGFVGARLQA